MSVVKQTEFEISVWKNITQMLLWQLIYSLESNLKWIVCVTIQIIYLDFCFLSKDVARQKSKKHTDEEQITTGFIKL